MAGPETSRPSAICGLRAPIARSAGRWTGMPRVGLAEQQVVRYLLDTCASAEEAKEALLLAKHYYFFTPCHFMVADRSGAAFVWEHSPRATAR